MQHGPEGPKSLWRPKGKAENKELGNCRNENKNIYRSKNVGIIILRLYNKYNVCMVVVNERNA